MSTYIRPDGFTGDANLNQIRDRFWEILAFFKANKDMANVAEVGSGWGEIARLLLHEKPSLNYRGCDINRQIVEDAQQNGLPITCEDAVTFLSSFEDDTLDFIIAIDVIEHLPKARLELLASQSFKKLKVGGSLMIRTPNAESIMASRGIYGDITHFRGFTFHSLKQIFYHDKMRIRFSSSWPNQKKLPNKFRRFLLELLFLYPRLICLLENGRIPYIPTRNINAYITKL